MFYPEHNMNMKGSLVNLIGWAVGHPKIAAAIALVLVVFIIMYFTSDPNEWDPSSLVPKAHLFGPGFKHYATVDMKDHRSLDGLRDRCHSKCVDDANCTGFQWLLDDRSRGQHCWMMEGDLKPVAVETPLEVDSMGYWAKTI